MTTENQKGTLAVDLTAFLASGVGADVTLTVGVTSLPAHRAILMARSQLFLATLSAGTPEASGGRVVVDDLEPEVLRQLLAFMYSDEAPQLQAMAAQVLPAADKYGLLLLRDKCERQLAQQLTVENAAATAVLSLRHRCHHLRAAAVKFIQENAFRVMFTDGWAEALRHHSQTVAKIWVIAGLGPSGQQKNVSEEKASKLGWELYKAAAVGKVQKMQKLFAAGASLEARDADGSTALFTAALGGHVDAVRWLLEAGAEVDGRNSHQQTALHRAAEGGRASVIQLLAAASASVNAADESGDTPLHLSVENGHVEAARALLQAGADKSIRNNAQKTPRDVLSRRNRRRMALLIFS